MKKTLLATALAVGFAGAAAAQTSVTLFGVVDGGLGYVQVKDKNTGDKATRTGLFDGNQQGNRWGLRGVEDLGGGLRASFHLESGWSLNTGRAGQNTVAGDTRLFGRTAKLALGSDSWGEIAYGRQVNFASRYVAGVAGVYDDAFGQGHIGASFTASGTQRYDNLVTYETPNFSGFQLGVGYSFQVENNQPSDIKGRFDTDRTAWTAAIRYSNGPLAVAASYDVAQKQDSLTGLVPLNQKDVKSWALGVSYDFDVARLHLGFGQDRDGVFGGSNLAASGLPTYLADNYKTNNYAVGVAVPLDSSSLAFNWQTSRLGSSKFKDDNRALGGKNSQNLYTVVYTYDLSKRTNVYAFGTHGTGYEFDNATVSQLVVGLRHRF